MIAGSIIIRRRKNFSTGSVAVALIKPIRCEDKRHLFRMTGEEEMYTPDRKGLLCGTRQVEDCLSDSLRPEIPGKARNRMTMTCWCIRANRPDTRNDVWEYPSQSQAIETSVMLR
jgi:hypothetical protein